MWFAFGEGGGWVKEGNKWDVRAWRRVVGGDISRLGYSEGC